MSDDIETPEVDIDDIDDIETSDEKSSAAVTVAIVAAGVAVGLGLGYGVRRCYRSTRGDKTPEDIINDHSEE